MSIEGWVLLIFVLLLGGLYYLLSVVALRDLYRRPGVRTGNKVGWALAILCLPIIGALLYEHMGASGFLPRNRKSTRPATQVASPNSPKPLDDLR